MEDSFGQSGNIQHTMLYVGMRITRYKIYVIDDVPILTPPLQHMPLNRRIRCFAATLLRPRNRSASTILCCCR